MTHKAPPNLSFYNLGIAPKILEVLDRMCFTVPTPIQHKAIPVCSEGKDIIGIAQTGTGKTHSFAIPMVQRLEQKKGIGLVLAPTRELAIQIEQVFKLMNSGFKINCCYGTKTVYKITKLMQQFGKLFTRLQQGPNIFIGTYVHLNEYNQ